MYSWDYSEASWKPYEIENIKGICRYFSYFNIFPRYVSLPWDNACDNAWDAEKFLKETIIKDVINIDKPTKDYKISDRQKLKKIIKKIIYILDSIPQYTDLKGELKKILDRINSPEKLCVDAIREVLESFEEIEAKNDTLQELIKKLKRLLPAKHLILGEFYSDTKKIIIYMKNIKKVAGSGIEANVLVEEVVVHELVHYYHFIMSDPYASATWLENGEENGTRESYKKSAVQESLADAFSYSYLLRKELIDISGKTYYQNAIKRLKEKWEEYDYPYFPYSGAKAFLLDSNGWDNELFEIVFKNAQKQWRIPYKIIKETIDKGRMAGIRVYEKESEKISPLERIAKAYPESDQDEIERLINHIWYHLPGRINVHRFLKCQYSLDEIKELDDLLFWNWDRIKSDKTILEMIYGKEIEELRNYLAQ